MDEYERYIDLCGRGRLPARSSLHAWGDPVRDAKLAENLRKWAGDDAPLMFDGSAGWDLVTSQRFGRVLEGLGYLWYEEPMREFDLNSYRRLADALDIPGAGGRDLRRQPLEHGHVDRDGRARHGAHPARCCAAASRAD